MGLHVWFVIFFFCLVFLNEVMNALVDDGWNEYLVLFLGLPISAFIITIFLSMCYNTALWTGEFWGYYIAAVIFSYFIRGVGNVAIDATKGTVRWFKDL